MRYKRDGAWHDVTYAQLAEIVQEIGLGLIDLGIAARRARLHPRQHPPRVVLRRHGRHLRGRRGRADLPDQLPRGVPVGDLRLRRHARSSARTTSSSRRSRRSASRLPEPAHGHHDRPRRRRPTNGARRGARRDHARARCASAARSRSAEELEARRAAVKPEDPFTFIYTSGTTGPPKGCVLTHGNYRAIIDMVCEVRRDRARTRSSTCTCRSRTPTRCSIQLAAFDLGSTLAYFGGDTKQIVAELMEVKPTYLPSVPRIFEKIYTLAHGAIEAQPPEERERAQAGDRARHEGARHDEPRRAGPRGAAAAVRGGRRAAVQERARDLRRQRAPRHQRRRADRAARSSSSSGPAACRCSRATA